MDVETVTLSGLHWPIGASGRIWFCQPRVQLTTLAPFRPTQTVRTLDIFDAVLERDADMGAPPGGAPSIVLVPEMSVSPLDLPALKTRITAARSNTLVICGVGHMDAPQIDTIEPSDGICGPPVPGTYANCAIIGCGGRNEFYLQPKVIPSRGELDSHWPGRVIRYFVGRYVSFVVFICSEMLDRAQAITTIRQVLDALAENSRQLTIVFWLQHNPKPRSTDFSQSLDSLGRLDRPTIFVAGSRNQTPPRLENYAVSGALFKKTVLPRRFSLLTRRFHYVEPVRDSSALSRVVLLRYDVDVNLVETVLANAIEEGDRTQRSQLFASATPLTLQNGTLVDSGANVHLAEIIQQSRETAKATDTTQSATIDGLADQLVALGTPKLQDFLDRAIIPRPSDESQRHAAGQQHSEGDYFCKCWKHRECIDFLSERDDSEPVAQILLALNRISAQGLQVELIAEEESRTNVRLSGSTATFEVCVVYPFNFDAEGTERAIRGQRPMLQEPGYIVLGTSGRTGRPALSQISQAVARPLAPLQAGGATQPMLRAIYYEELAAGNLLQLLEERFG